MTNLCSPGSQIRLPKARTAWSSTCAFSRAPARHCDELAYLFRHDVDGPLADLISDTWLAFARTGNPNHDGLPEWPPYSFPERETMVLDHRWRVELDRLGDVRRIWQEIPISLVWTMISGLARLDTQKLEYIADAKRGRICRTRERIGH
jgi:Carboxylesterase family